MENSQRHIGWRGKILLTTMVITLSGLSACAVVEVYIRLTKPYETPDTLRQKSLEYEATLFARHAFPQMVQWKQGTWRGPWSVAINERGYRGKSFDVPKPKDVVRVVILGGSAAFDASAEEGQDWPSLTRDRMHAKGYTHVDVINAATPGYATWDSLGRLYAEIWMIQPDYVVVYHAWNDIKYFSWLTPDHSLLRGFRPASTAGDSKLIANPFLYYSGWLDRWLSHSQLYTRMRSRYLSWQIGEIGLEGLIRLRGGRQDRPSQPSYLDSYGPYGPRQYELNLSLIVDAAQNIGAIPILLTQARLVSSSNSEADRQRIAYDLVNLSHAAIVRAFADCDRAILAVANAKGVPVLDLARMFTGRSELFHDHVHLSPAGSAAIAQALADFLSHLLDKAQAHAITTQ